MLNAYDSAAVTNIFEDRRIENTLGLHIVSAVFETTDETASSSAGIANNR